MWANEPSGCNIFRKKFALVYICFICINIRYATFKHKGWFSFPEPTPNCASGSVLGPFSFLLLFIDWISWLVNVRKICLQIHERNLTGCQSGLLKCMKAVIFQSENCGIYNLRRHRTWSRLIEATVIAWQHQAISLPAALLITQPWGLMAFTWRPCTWNVQDIYPWYEIENYWFETTAAFVRDQWFNRAFFHGSHECIASRAMF